MSPTGPYYPTVAVNNSSFGQVAWTNPTNAEVSDTVYATASLVSNTSNYLVTTGYGFTLPHTAIVDGIMVEIQRYGPAVQTELVGIVIAGAISNSKAPLEQWPSGSEAWASYGGPTDLWGLTPLYSDINNSGFGAYLSAISSGTNTASVDSFRITVYWHTAPTTIPQQRTYLYKVFDSQSGNYIGNLQNPNGDFSFSQDINTAGSQVTIDCALTIDTSALSLSAILDENGNNITDETLVNVNDEGTAPSADIGTSQAIIRNGNRVQIWLYDNYYPNGKCLFKGIIERVAPNLGGDTGDEKVTILIYSDGQDLDQFLVTTAPTVDQQNTSTDSTIVVSGAYSQPQLGQEITPGAGVNNIDRITLKMAAVSAYNPANGVNYPVVTVGLYASSSSGALNFSRLASNATPDAIATQVITSTTTDNYDFLFNYTFPGAQPSFYLFNITCTDANGVNVSYNSTLTYSGGNMVAARGSYNTSVLWFQTYAAATSTAPTYTSEDPSNMLLGIMASYGGLITASSASVTATGLSLTYQFNAATTYEAIKSILSLAPGSFYYYVDLGTDILYFQQANTKADVTLIKGVHLNKVIVTNTIEYVVNTVYVIGGIVSGNNIFTFDQNAKSVSLYGQRMQRHVDNNITDTGTAHTVAKNIIAANKNEQYQTTVSIIHGTMDTTTLKPGMIVGFSGFGIFVDNLLAQIVHIDYTPEQTTLKLGILPKRTTVAVEQINRNLIALNSVSNPSTPS